MGSLVSPYPPGAPATGESREVPREEAREVEGAGSREPREGIPDNQGHSNVTQVPAERPVSAVSSAPQVPPRPARMVLSQAEVLEVEGPLSER